MSYLKEYEWELIPKTLPTIRRICPKCGKKTNYINTKKFRVNANKSNLDVWLIYQCDKCKSTYNMTIYKRIKPIDISRYEYEKFLSNDEDLAKEYSFNLDFYSKNKAEAIFDDITYSVEKKEIETNYCDSGEIIINIISKFPTNLRVDKLLSDNLDLTRSTVKKLYETNYIYSNEHNDLLKLKVKNNMQIRIKNFEA